MLSQKASNVPFWHPPTYSRGSNPIRKVATEGDEPNREFPPMGAGGGCREVMHGVERIRGCEVWFHKDERLLVVIRFQHINKCLLV
jgi:hypothetical protein